MAYLLVVVGDVGHLNVTKRFVGGKRHLDGEEALRVGGGYGKFERPGFGTLVHDW